MQTSEPTLTERSVSFKVRDHPDAELQPFISSAKAKNEERRSQTSYWSGRLCVLAKVFTFLVLFVIVYVCVIFGFPLEWDPRPLLFHLKIPKSGSSSLDFTLELYEVLRPWNRCVSKDMFHDFLHFDWSYIEAVARTDHPRLVATFRDPVDRAVSHFTTFNSKTSLATCACGTSRFRSSSGIH